MYHFLVRLPLQSPQTLGSRSVHDSYICFDDIKRLTVVVCGRSIIKIHAHAINLKVSLFAKVSFKVRILMMLHRQ